MPRDYAKKSKKAPAKRQGAARHGRGTGKQKSPPRVWRWYGAGVLSGVLMCFLLYLGTLPPDLGSNGSIATNQEQPTAKQHKQQEPRFDFYTMLEDQKIEVEVDPGDIEQARQSQPKEVYLLQTGSFRQLKDADRRRAELLLIGLDPTVEETNGDNGRWYRVYVGPFASRSKLAKARSLTAAQDIDTLLLKRSND